MKYRIRELREKRKLSQEELARKAKISRTIVARLESNNEYETQIGTLQKIADALGVSIKTLFVTEKFNG